HGNVVEACVIEPGDQMGRAGARRCNANAQLTSELGVSAGHECRHLFMASLDEVYFLVRAIERAEDTIDAVTRIPEQNPDTPLVKPIDQEIPDCLCHGRSLGRMDAIIPQGLYP